MFNIDSSLYDGIVYLVPLKQVVDDEYVIICKDVEHAEVLIKKFKRMKNLFPTKDHANFMKIREFEKFDRKVKVIQFKE